MNECNAQVLELFPLAPKRQKLSTDYSSCIVCQERTSESLLCIQPLSLNTLQYATTNRTDDAAQRLKPEIDRLDFFSYKPKWHNNCRSIWTSKTNVDRCLTSHEATMGSAYASVPPYTRSNAGCEFDYKTMCVICTKKDVHKPTNRFHSVQTRDREKTFYQKAKVLSQECPEVLVRIEGDGKKSIDMVALEVHYHAICMNRFMNTRPKYEMKCDPYKSAFEALLVDIERPLKEGMVFLTTSLRDKYRIHLSEQGIDSTRYAARNLKDRLQTYFGTEITFFSPKRGEADYAFLDSSLSAGALVTAIETLRRDINENYIPLLEENDATDKGGGDMPDSQKDTLLYTAAKRIKFDLDQMFEQQDKEKDTWEVSSETAQRLVPKSLYNFLSYVCTDRKVAGDVKEADHERILHVAQDLLFCATGIRTPKHVGLAVYVYQKTRCKDLIILLNKLGNSISYTDLQRILTTVALEMLDETSDAYVPGNIHPNAFHQFAIDNLDFSELANLDGTSKHVTSMAIFQDRRGWSTAGGTMGAVPTKPQRKRSINKVTFQQKAAVRSEVAKVPRKIRPSTDVELSYLLHQADQEFHNLDTAWMLVRLCPTKLLDIEVDQSTSPIPSFKAFCANISQCNRSKTEIGYMPFLPRSPTKEDVVAEALHICMQTSQKLGDEYTIVTQDLAIYEISYGLRQAAPDDYKGLTLRLGGFHLLMNFLGTIGKLMSGSGLMEIFVKSNILLEGTANKVLAGKAYYQSMRAHSVVYEAVHATWWEALEDWCLREQKDAEMFRDLGQLIENLLTTIERGDNKEIYKGVVAMDGILTAAEELISEFNMAHKDQPTHKLWCLYMDMVKIALQFLFAEREGQWSLHLNATSDMLPYIVSAGHHKYGTQLVNYLLEMRKLPKSIEEAFQEGCFSIKRSNGKFVSIWTDMALECGLNADAKGRRGQAGLSGLALQPETQEKWFACLPFTTAVTSDMRSMLNMGIENGNHHDCNIATTQHDSEARDRVMGLLSDSRNPFTSQTTDLINLMTGEIAQANVKEKLLNAKEIGLTELQEYLSGSHKKLSIIKLATFEKPEPETKLDKTKAASADRSEEVVMLKRAFLMDRSETSLQDLLSHEILSHPPSISEQYQGEVTLRSGSKATLLECMKENLPDKCWPMQRTNNSALGGTGYVVDLMGYIHTQSPEVGETLESFAERLLLKLIQQCPTQCTDMHIVADRYDGLYVEDSQLESISLKDASGCHSRRKSSAAEYAFHKDQSIKDWKRVLHSNASKANLIQALFNSWENSCELVPEGLTVCFSGGFFDRKKCIKITSTERKVETELACTHEEGDTRVILHTQDCVKKGCSCVIISANDTDIVVLAVYFYPILALYGLVELWVKFPQYYIPVHLLLRNMDREFATTLPLLHALSGCDTTSFIYGKGKKSFLKAAIKPTIKTKLATTCTALRTQGYSESLAQQIVDVATELMIVIYSPSANELKDLNSLRAVMYIRRKDLKSLPPTDDSFRLHVLRSILQTLIWLHADEPAPSLPNPLEFGWKFVNKRVRPILSSFTPAPASLSKVAFCVCKVKCGKRCPCRHVGTCELPCACSGKSGMCNLRTASMTAGELQD